MPGLPTANCLLAAIATPVGSDLRPDPNRLAARAGNLLSAGCDGIALFGTTGEGAAFTLADRTGSLEAVLAAGIAPDRVIVSAGALALDDSAALARHATALGVAGVLLMPPCMFREGVTEEGTFAYYDQAIAKTASRDLRLYLYHFPGISGVAVTPRVIRRLDERHPGLIAGVKDSGGDIDHTKILLRRFPHLAIYTGSEIHLPELLSMGLRGSICGLANVIPEFLRRMIDLPTAFDRRRLLPSLLAADAILSRQPFVPSAKAVVAADLTDPDWRRVMPPLSGIPSIEGDRMLADFARWRASLADATSGP